MVIPLALWPTDQPLSLTTLVLFLRPDATIDPWLGDLWGKVLELYPVPLDLPVIPHGVP